MGSRGRGEKEFYSVIPGVKFESEQKIKKQPQFWGGPGKFEGGEDNGK